MMKNYDAQLSKEEVSALVLDPYNTKVFQALMECRFKPQLGFLDNRGSISKKLESIFPDDDPKQKSLNIDMGIESVKLHNKNTFTESYLSVNRAFFNRDHIVPGTLNHYCTICKEHLNLYKSIFDDIELGRFAIRIKQVNKIKDEIVKSTKTKFANDIIGANRLFNIIKKPDINIKHKNYITVYRSEESFTRAKEIYDYSVRIQLCLLDSESMANLTEEPYLFEDSDALYFHSDLDFSIRKTKTNNIDIEQSIRLSNRFIERASEIHSSILEVISNG